MPSSVVLAKTKMDAWRTLSFSRNKTSNYVERWYPASRRD
ncbi:hypothetical protein FOPG_18716 [Fusarium oxysporum f. sp. conglutinans race 2 54008]|uniref:Uncharacterized protein n=1 Tax=Fusarium oxysporum f. sp. conglutinans race 2 54008 TaxID=1089457 RepID=X0GP07_FUSOX|nr:hypothetical protein FOPG_18716 [Fusarium oxysporum f. sp. conglutinans race 2 54008]